MIRAREINPKNVANWQSDSESDTDTEDPLPNLAAAHSYASLHSTSSSFYSDDGPIWEDAPGPAMEMFPNVVDPSRPIGKIDLSRYQNIAKLYGRPGMASDQKEKTVKMKEEQNTTVARQEAPAKKLDDGNLATSTRSSAGPKRGAEWPKRLGERIFSTTACVLYSTKPI